MRVSLYSGGDEVTFSRFDATGTTNLDFFAVDKVLAAGLAGFAWRRRDPRPV